MKAVGYSTKSKRNVLPKMVLIGDIVGNDANQVATAASEVIRIANQRVGEGFVAISPESRKKFWLDRARTGAISRHTNAFKINEDVVIPLPRMASIPTALNSSILDIIKKQDCFIGCSRAILLKWPNATWESQMMTSVNSNLQIC
jgi:FAD/FMN-containing dehydrogenase